MSGYGIPFGGVLPPLTQNGHGNPQAPFPFSPYSNRGNFQTPPPGPLETLQVPFNPYLTVSRQQWEVQPWPFSDFQGNGALQQKVQAVLSNSAQTQGRFLSPHEVSIPQPPSYSPPTPTTQFHPTNIQSHSPYPLQGNPAQFQSHSSPDTTTQSASSDRHRQANPPWKFHSQSIAFKKMDVEDEDAMIPGYFFSEENSSRRIQTGQAVLSIVSEYVRQGKIYLVKGDYDAALTLMDNALALNKNFADAHAYKAEAFQKKDDIAKSLEAAEKALAIKQDHPIALQCKSFALNYSANSWETQQSNKN